MATTIQISDKLWLKLNRMKLKGETFESVLLRALKHEEFIVKPDLDKKGEKSISSGEKEVKGK
jgi:predicted CopG family antitoxin